MLCASVRAGGDKEEAMWRHRGRDFQVWWLWTLGCKNIFAMRKPLGEKKNDFVTVTLEFSRTNLPAPFLIPIETLSFITMT